MAHPRNDSEQPDPSSQPPRSRGGRRGRATRPRHPKRPCLNCGDPTPGEYCPTCGQRKVDVQVSVRALAMDLLEDQFFLDQRLPRTLGALLFKPGRLTVEYVNGRIVRYIHPFRLYLASSLIFFVLLSFFSLRFVRNAMEGRPDAEWASSVSPNAVDEALTEVRVQLADTLLTGEERAAVEAAEAVLIEQWREARLDSVNTRISELTTALGQLDGPLADSGVPAPVRSALGANRSLMLEELRTATARREALLADTLGPAPAVDSPTAGVDERPVREVFGWGENPPSVQLPYPPLQEALEEQIERMGRMTRREAVESIASSFFNYVPTVLFILLPVFAAVLKLLYIRQGRYYAEHFVFLLHVHSVVFILATVGLLLRSYLPLLIELLLALWALVYIYMAMKRVYAQGWLKTFLKYWTLGWAYFWILLGSLPVAIVITLLLF